MIDFGGECGDNRPRKRIWWADYKYNIKNDDHKSLPKLSYGFWMSFAIALGIKLGLLAAACIENFLNLLFSF